MARESTAALDFPRALEQYQWCVEHGLDVRRAFVGAWAGRVIPELVALGNSYAPARDYVVLLEKKLEGVVEASRATSLLEIPEVFAVVELHEDLGHRARTLDLMNRSSAPVRNYLWSQLLPRLVRTKDYSAIATHEEDCRLLLEDEVRRFKRHLDVMRGSADPADVGQRQDMVRGDAADCFEGLLGGGNIDGARAMATRVLTELPGDATVNTLRDRARAIQHPEWEAIIEEIAKSLPVSAASDTSPPPSTSETPNR
jgi:hypothetical protein